MRITNSMMTNNLMNNLYSSMSRMDKYNAQLASNRKITRLSDDAIGVLNSMNARQRLFRIQQYQENIVNAKNWVDQTEVALNDIESSILKIKENLVLAATDSNNADDKKNYATLIGQFKEHIMQAMNSAIGDKYLFAGFNSTKEPFSVDTNGKVLYNGKDLTSAAFLGDRTPTHGKIADVKVPGSADITDVKWDTATGIGTAMNNKYYMSVEDGELVFKDSVKNVVGSVPLSSIDLAAGELDLSSIGPAVGGGLGKITWTPTAPPLTNPDDIKKAQENIAASLSETYITTPAGEEYGQNIEFEVGFNLKMQVSFTGIELAGTGNDNIFKVLDDIVNALNTDAPISTISGFIKDMDQVQSRVLNTLVNVGARSINIDSLDSRYAQDFINYEGIRGDVEDIDQAAVIMNFKMSEAIYKQALATGARIIQPTLMDFLR